MSIRPGDTLADRYRLDDLLSESGSGRFWLAHDCVLQRHVALHVIAADDARGPGLLDAARRSATVVDPRILRVLDAQRRGDLCFVVNEWGLGTSLDIALANNGPLVPRRAAWLVAEVADSVAVAHAQGVHHGRLSPENVLVDSDGGVRIIGFAVDAALHGLPPGDEASDVRDLGGLLHACLTGKWAGDSSSAVPAAPREGDRVMRPRQVRAGVPRPLDDLVDELLNPGSVRLREIREVREVRDPAPAATVADVLTDFVGDPAGIAESLAEANPVRPPDAVVLDQVPELMVREEPAPAARVAPVVTPVREPQTAPPAPVAGAAPLDDHIDDFLSRYAGPASAADLIGEADPHDDDLHEDELQDDLWRSDHEIEPWRQPRPLFAPEPSDGAAQARAREARVARAARCYPDDPDDSDDSGGPHSTDGSSTHLTGRVGGATAMPDVPGRSGRPGRGWLRTAAALALSLVLLIAAAVGWSAVRSLGDSPDDTSAAGGTDRVAAVSTRDRAPAPTGPEGSVVDGVTARLYDPTGSTGSAAGDPSLALDDDPDTAWTTGASADQLGPGSERPGVGLVLDTGTQREISQVDLALDGAPSYLTVYVLPSLPSSLSTVRSAASFDARRRETVGLPAGTTGRYVVLWFTQVPRDGTSYVGGIAEATLRG